MYCCLFKTYIDFFVGTVRSYVGGLVGAVDGTGTNVKFSNPVGIALDSDANMYVADCTNNLIRKISPIGIVFY